MNYRTGDTVCFFEKEILLKGFVEQYLLHVLFIDKIARYSVKKFPGFYKKEDLRTVRLVLIEKIRKWKNINLQ